MCAGFNRCAIALPLDFKCYICTSVRHPLQIQLKRRIDLIVPGGCEGKAKATGGIVMTLMGECLSRSRVCMRAWKPSLEAGNGLASERR